MLTVSDCVVLFIGFTSGAKLLLWFLLELGKFLKADSYKT